MMGARREKVFGPGRAVPLDRNAKCRIAAYARAWSARQPPAAANTRARSPAPSWTSCRRCCGASTTAGTAAASRATSAIADRAGCARSTVAEALKVLEWAGVLTWQHRITRIRERCTDLFGRISWQWRVHRRSNAYAFRDPQQQIATAIRLSVRKSARNTEPSDSWFCTCTSTRSRQFASNVPLPDSAQLLQQGRALNKTPACRPVLHSHQ